MLAGRYIQDNTAAEVREVKKQVVLHSITPKKGHTVFEYDSITGALIPAKITEVNATIEGGVRKKVITRDNCIYASALNKANALKKVVKLLRS